VHRVGRTGRAGRTGESISLVTKHDWAQAKELISILEEANQVIFYVSYVRKYVYSQHTLKFCTVFCNPLSADKLSSEIT